MRNLTTTAPPVPRRLRAIGGGRRGNWFDTASAALSCLPSGLSPDPWPDSQTLPTPWCDSARQPISFLLAGADIRRDDLPDRRRVAALESLQQLRENTPLTAIEIWSDGAASGGTHNGGAGVLIKWHDGREDTTISAAAGALASSTSAEAAAALLGVTCVAGELQCSTPTGRLAIRLLFDSRALHSRLQRPMWRIEDSATRDTALLLGTLAQAHDVSVIWVPGHAGIASNERADRAAITASESAEQGGAAIPSSALKHAVARSVADEALATYHASMVGHIHFEASAGGQIPDFSNLPRRSAVLHQLRLNRWPGLRATRHRWGLEGAESPSCQQCDSEDADDTRHFLLQCPRTSPLRTQIFGPSPSLSLLQTDPLKVLSFLESAAPS